LPAGVTLGQVAGGLLVLGGAVTFGWFALGAAEYEMVNHSGLNRAELAAYLHKADSASSLAPLIVLFLLGIVLGTILLAIAARRVRIVPIWASVAIAAAGILGFFGNGKGISIVSFAILLLGLGTLDRDYDRGSAAARSSAPPTRPVSGGPWAGHAVAGLSLARRSSDSRARSGSSL
jgi:hypothetical protein